MLTHHHHTTLEQTVPLAFGCARCGWQGMVSVVGKGQASSASYAGGLIGDEGGSHASSVAQDRALKDAKVTIGLLPCPQCGARRLAKLIPFALWNGLLVLAPALLPLALGVGTAQKGDLGELWLELLFTTGFAWAVAFVLFRRSFGRHLVGAAERATFRAKGEKSAARQAREAEPKTATKQRRRAARPQPPPEG